MADNHTPDGRKYNLMQVTDEHRKALGLPDSCRFRVVAARDIFTTVKGVRTVLVPGGTIGGYVTSDRNLSSYGSCWIHRDARVVDLAIVEDDAQVGGHAVVQDSATVSGTSSVTSCAHHRAVVQDAAIVRDSAVRDHAVIRDNAQLQQYSRVSGHVSVGGFARLISATVSGYGAVLRGECGTVPVGATIGNDADIARTAHVVTVCSTPWGPLTVYRTQSGAARCRAGCTELDIDDDWHDVLRDALDIADDEDPTDDNTYTFLASLIGPVRALARAVEAGWANARQ